MIKFSKFVAEQYVRLTTKFSAVEVQKAAAKIAKTIVSKYEKHGSDKTSSRPAGPDTTKFHATTSYMVKAEHGINVPQGMFNRHHLVFIKIGSGVDRQIAKKIREEFAAAVEKKLKLTKRPAYNDNNDGFYVDEVSGTNWGGIGIVQTK